MDDDLRKLPRFIRLSRDTFRVLRKNIALAIGIKAVFFILALVGKATLWMAVFADMGASLIVVFNGMRLLARMFHKLPINAESIPFRPPNASQGVTFA